jgi:ferritin-like metal-binding protein YciE
MQAENLSDLFERGLEFAWDCESQLIHSLPEIAEACCSPDLKQAFFNHLEETRQHAERLKEIFGMLNRAANGETSGPVKAISQEASKLAHHIERSPLRDSALIFNAHQIEHYEIALYGSLVSFARALGHQDAACLLDLTLYEEKEADRKLTVMAEQKINREAAEYHNAAPFALI